MDEFVGYFLHAILGDSRFVLGYIAILLGLLQQVDPVATSMPNTDPPVLCPSPRDLGDLDPALLGQLRKREPKKSEPSGRLCCAYWLGSVSGRG